jgi:hypothetical protein
MPPAGLEPAIPAGERLQTQALDRSATGIGILIMLQYLKNCIQNSVHIFDAAN